MRLILQTRKLLKWVLLTHILHHDSVQMTQWQYNIIFQDGPTWYFASQYIHLVTHSSLLHQRFAYMLSPTPENCIVLRHTSLYRGNKLISYLQQVPNYSRNSRRHWENVSKQKSVSCLLRWFSLLSALFIYFLFVWL